MLVAPEHAGIVRVARRPPGWTPRGPAPAVDRLDASLWPGPGEDLCFLAGDWRILQRRDGHRWSLDDLATAWFAIDDRERRGLPAPDRFLDLGCGVGTVLLLLAWRYPDARGLGIEAQELSAGLARRSLRRNGAAGRCEVRTGDFRDRAPDVERAAFDLVTGTPPYVPIGAGAESPRSAQRTAARLELRGGIEAYCAAAAPLLAPDGRFVACAVESWPGRIAEAAASAGLAIARRRDVVPRAGKAPLFTLVALRRAARDEVASGDGAGAAALPCALPLVACEPALVPCEPALVACEPPLVPCEPALVPCEPALVIRDAAGRRTEEARAMRDALGMPP